MSLWLSGTVHFALGCFLAAMAIEVGATFITTDAGFARFPGLRWRRPFDTNPGRR